jgi:hypothetical protein
MTATNRAPPTALTRIGRSVPIVQMHAETQAVRPAIEELQGDVPAHKFQQVVIAHPERISGAEAARVPTVDGGHRARIRHERSERNDHVTVCAVACGYGPLTLERQLWLGSRRH